MITSPFPEVPLCCCGLFPRPSSYVERGGSCGKLENKKNEEETPLSQINKKGTEEKHFGIQYGSLKSREPQDLSTNTLFIEETVFKGG